MRRLPRREIFFQGDMALEFTSSPSTRPDAATRRSNRSARQQTDPGTANPTHRPSRCSSMRYTKPPTVDLKRDASGALVFN